MSLPDTVCAVLLIEEAYAFLGEAIAPYVKEGRIGKYIYCTSAVQNGNFMDMTLKPAQCDGSVKDTMTISVPVHLVKFMATGRKTLPFGFSIDS